MTMMRARSVLAAIVCAGLVSTTVHAQDRLAVGGLEVVPAGSGFGSTIGPAGALAGQLADGGRFGLMYDKLIDRLTGAEVEFFNAYQLSLLVTDPARPRAFFAHRAHGFAPADAVMMANLRTGVVTPLLDLPAVPVPGAIVTARFAVDAQRLVVLYPTPNGGAPEWAVVDVAAATPATRRLAIPAPIAWGGTWWTISPDGTTLYRAVDDFQSSTSAIVVHDLATGAEVQRLALPFALGTDLSWNEALDAIVAARPGAGVMTFTALARDLTPLGTGVVPQASPCGVQVAISPASGRVYTFSGGGSYFGMALPATLTGGQLGAAGPTDVADVDAEAKVNCGGLHLASPPGAPRRLSGSVAGHTVSFAWENVGGASQFTIEAGVAPGRTDVSITLGPDSQWSLAGVPSGTYYVRVRGANTVGIGAVSQEIPVVVP